MLTSTRFSSASELGYKRGKEGGTKEGRKKEGRDGQVKEKLDVVYIVRALF